MYLLRKELFTFVLCSWVFFPSVSLYTMSMPGVFRSQEMVLCFIKLELQVVMRYYVVARNKTPILWKRCHCSYPLRHLFSPYSHISYTILEQ